MDLENKFCVYLTTYKGNKLPPFYIGSSTIEKINGGYKGSVTSKNYSKIWKTELKENPHLFTTRIICVCKTRKIAFDRENYFQHKLNVVKSAMYINKAYAKDMSYMTGSGDKNGMYGKKHTEKTKFDISVKNAGRILTPEQKAARKEKRMKKGKMKYTRKDLEYKGSSYGTTLYSNPITRHSIRLTELDQIPIGYEKGQLSEKTEIQRENMKGNLLYYDPITKVVKRFKNLKDVPENWIKGNLNLIAKSALYGVTYIKNFETGECFKTDSTEMLQKFYGHIRSKYAYIYENKVTFDVFVFIKHNEKLNTNIIKNIYKNNKISKKAKTLHPFLIPYDYYCDIGITIIPIEIFMKQTNIHELEWLN